MRQPLAVAFCLQHVHHVVGVFEHGVVHGAAAAGTGAFVVHPQAAADIHGADGRAQVAQFTVKPGAFFQAGLDVADVGDL